MKIATWNVNGIRASLNKGLKDFVKEVSPDILCLQETKAHPDQLNEPWEELKNYPFQFWSSCGKKKGYSGTFSCSKKTVLKISEGLGIKKFDWEGRMITFEYDSFLLLNIYFPNGAMTEERHLFKQEFLRRLPRFLSSLRQKTGKGLIVVGDYNVAYMDIDVFSPETLQTTSGFLPEERKWFRSFLKEGYIDVFRHFYPGKKDSFTWWSLREGARRQNRGWRIDHICVSEDLKPRLKNIKIYQDQLGSDHCPLVMELEDNN